MSTAPEPAFTSQSGDGVPPEFDLKVRLAGDCADQATFIES